MQGIIFGCARARDRPGRFGHGRTDGTSSCAPASRIIPRERPAPLWGSLAGAARQDDRARGLQLGCEVVVLELKDEFPANSLDTHTLVGDWNDPAILLEMAGLTDVITLENEFVEAARSPRSSSTATTSIRVGLHRHRAGQAHAETGIRRRRPAGAALRRRSGAGLGDGVGRPFGWPSF